MGWEYKEEDFLSYRMKRWIQKVHPLEFFCEEILIIPINIAFINNSLKKNSVSSIRIRTRWVDLTVIYWLVWPGTVYRRSGLYLGTIWERHSEWLERGQSRNEWGQGSGFSLSRSVRDTEQKAKHFEFYGKAKRFEGCLDGLPRVATNDEKHGIRCTSDGTDHRRIRWAWLSYRRPEIRRMSKRIE